MDTNKTFYFVLFAVLFFLLLVWAPMRHCVPLLGYFIRVHSRRFVVNKIVHSRLRDLVRF